VQLEVNEVWEEEEFVGLFA